MPNINLDCSGPILVEDMVNTINGKTDIGHTHSEYYNKTEFLESSGGVSDAGKPIKLNSQGIIDSSMLDVSTFYYIGPFTPTAGNEYPDTTGESFGAFWVVEGVDATNGYTFTSGDLNGKTVNNGDFMVWAAAGWSIMAGEMNPLLYYKLDGTQAITAPFAGGAQQIKNIADGSDIQDAITLNQLNNHNHDSIYVNISGDAMSGSLEAPDITVHTGIDILGDTASGNIFFRTNDDINTSLLQFMNAAGDRVGYVGRTSGDSDTIRIIANLGDIDLVSDNGIISVAGDKIATEPFVNTGLNGKSDIGHGHTISDITDLQTTLDGKLDLTGKAADSELLDGIDSTGFVRNNTTPVPGSDKITNMISCTQAEYDAITRDPNTLYIITD